MLRTRAASVALATASFLAFLVLAACSSSPPASSASSAPSKSVRESPSAPAPARGGKPDNVARADRNFDRPTRGPVIRNFDGVRNKGIDFAGAQGDPVYAAREGKVVYAADGILGYGRMILIQHDKTFLSAYAHNSELLVKSGETVRRGQLIARMGSTEADRVELHFELRRAGNAVDPTPYFLPLDGSNPS